MTNLTHPAEVEAILTYVLEHVACDAAYNDHYYRGKDVYGAIIVRGNYHDEVDETLGLLPDDLAVSTITRTALEKARDMARKEMNDE